MRVFTFPRTRRVNAPLALQSLLLLSGLLWCEAAQSAETWLTLAPGWGPVWVDSKVQGTLQQPGRFAAVTATGKFFGAGFGGVLEWGQSSWSKDSQSGIGPLAVLRVMHAQNLAVSLDVDGSGAQAVADNLAHELSATAQQVSFQGGIHLTTLSGLLQWRVLAGAGGAALTVNELDGKQGEYLGFVALGLGGVFRLPARSIWAAVLGVHCGYNKYVWYPGGATVCVGNVGANWTFLR